MSYLSTSTGRIYGNQNYLQYNNFTLRILLHRIYLWMRVHAMLGHLVLFQNGGCRKRKLCSSLKFLVILLPLFYKAMLYCATSPRPWNMQAENGKHSRCSCYCSILYFYAGIAGELLSSIDTTFIHGDTANIKECRLNVQIIK